MSLQTLNLVNQFGEISANEVLSGTAPVGPIAAHTVIMNNTGSSASPTAVAVQSVSNALPAKAGVTAISAFPAVTVALSTGNTYTDAAVNTAINTALASVLTDINAFLAAVKVVS